MQDKNTPPGLSGLQALVDEIGQANAQASIKSFVPLTDGLGLESPRKREFSYQIEKVAKPAPSPKVEADLPMVSPTHLPMRQENSLAAIMGETEKPPVLDKSAERAEIKTPPPVPCPSFTRRLLATIVDEVFVLALWSLAVVITHKAQTGSFQGFSPEGLGILRDPSFVRFVALEFVTIWLAYFVFCIGLLDMTFGMWVWSFRVSYGSSMRVGRVRRKLGRILLSFCFYAPIVPLFLLVFRRKGRSLLDALSGTQLYLTPA